MEWLTGHPCTLLSRIFHAAISAAPAVIIITATSTGAAVAAEETFTIDDKEFAITIYPGPEDGNKYPVLMLLHGNAGLTNPDGTLNKYGKQINEFARKLSDLNYVTAVPSYYEKGDNDLVEHLTQDDPYPHVATLAAAIKAAVDKRPEADPNRLGLIGYSLGAATAMAYIVSGTTPEAKVLVDYFGPVETPVRPDHTPVSSPILDGIDRFPPTIIFHDRKDKLVRPIHSETLESRFPATIPHSVHWYDGASALPHHAFDESSTAFGDSQEKAIDWLDQHLPPLPM